MGNVAQTASSVSAGAVDTSPLAVSSSQYTSEADALRAAHLLRNTSRVRLFEPRASDLHIRTSAGSDKVDQICSINSCDSLTRRADGLCAFHAETARARAE